MLRHGQFVMLLSTQSDVYDIVYYSSDLDINISYLRCDTDPISQLLIRTC